jgi:hypothetical protein
MLILELDGHTESFCQKPAVKGSAKDSYIMRRLSDVMKIDGDTLDGLAECLVRELLRMAT